MDNERTVSFIYEIGYIGQGKYNSANRLPYSIWNDMFKRCYSKKYHSTKPTYIDCSVAEEWLNFQNFAEWFEENYIEGFQLDKDILVKGNKIYSSKTCCFVPVEINSLFTKSNKIRGIYPIGVRKNKNQIEAFLSINSTQKYLGVFKSVNEAFEAYKVAKESNIQKIAEKWKDKISDKVYQAMYNYKVEITD